MGNVSRRSMVWDENKTCLMVAGDMGMGFKGRVGQGHIKRKREETGADKRVAMGAWIYNSSNDKDTLKNAAYARGLAACRDEDFCFGPRQPHVSSYDALNHDFPMEPGPQG